MAEAVAPGALGDAILELMEAYTEDVQRAIPKAIDDVAKDALRDLRARSPKATGRYARGWAVRTPRARGDTHSRIIHNKTDYQLTHLLEFGHANRDGGRTAGTLHVAPVADEHGARLLEKLGLIVESGGAR